MSTNATVAATKDTTAVAAAAPVDLHTTDKPPGPSVPMKSKKKTADAEEKALLRRLEVLRVARDRKRESARIAFGFGYTYDKHFYDTEAELRTEIRAAELRRRRLIAIVKEMHLDGEPYQCSCGEREREHTCACGTTLPVIP
jgi:hypothetical protein